MMLEKHKARRAARIVVLKENVARMHKGAANALNTSLLP